MAPFCNKIIFFSKNGDTFPQINRTCVIYDYALLVLSWGVNGKWYCGSGVSKLNIRPNKSGEIFYFPVWFIAMPFMYKLCGIKLHLLCADLATVCLAFLNLNGLKQWQEVSLHLLLRWKAKCRLQEALHCFCCVLSHLHKLATAVFITWTPLRIRI